MNCQNCGTELKNGETYCPICGAAVEQNNTAVQNAANSTPNLVWGIVAAALCESGLIGLIFAIIAKSKIKKYIAAGYAVDGKTRAGKILATVALIVSIVMMVFWVIYIIAIVIIALGAAALEGAL